jgi:hypothetical protein
MRVVFPVLAVFLLSTSSMAQQPQEWYRVYTFDDSVIEMNIPQVTFASDSIARARIRWVFDQPETLSGQPQLKYKSQFEIIEFDCSNSRFRTYEVRWLDATGKVIRLEQTPSEEWREVSGGFMEKLLSPACQMFALKTRPPSVLKEDLDLKKVESYALLFSQQLEQAKDFKPLIRKFFAANYIDGYLRDKSTNWFLNVNRDTAAKATPAELERYYIAVMNTGYLSFLYVSQKPSTDGQSIPEEKLMPAGFVRLIENHRYTATYKGMKSGYDYLAENIDSVERLRSYTDLLEKLDALLRRHVSADAVHSPEYHEMLDDRTPGLYEPDVRICDSECLGLPKGTKLFEIDVPVFHLQLAEIKGEIRIVSAMHYF